ncbi:phytanoyl-CoA dioxygenase family protein [Asticcacaulis sp. BYS171W]|uniref:Phytanoyl-CoA dioxygenase family protein n=1 Tax=Asticcacaulis aquaticus TaxID=2984212 RepID=A0ABT5HVU1_9CAUL|nr:phytanoyl-CoA dioxygenase family protein [Asticcacaulis aquaticus]MDC7684053.1 phytanoyl-CoA dioxygenase family protein [Asticcacaulis aquaticus]
MITLDNLDFARDGAVLHRAVLASEIIDSLRDDLDAQIAGRPGKRLTQGNTLLEATGALGRIAAGLIGEAARPVRAIIFDKSPATNWHLGWHQDRTIAVRERIEVEGFGPWSTKDGILHVAPPMSVLNGMVTLRLHLDDCDESNAPLKVALGSHRLGFVAADEASRVAESGPVLTCLARAGDVWAYATPILHMSERSQSPGRRRVLQVDYAATALPGGLDWRGV